MDLHPNVNDPVVLRDPSGRQYRSQVEDLAAGLLVVTEPADLPDDGSFGKGADVSVVWADGDGVVTLLPTRLLAAHANGTSQVWSLVPTGPAVAEQRRRFERVAAEGPVMLQPPAAREIEAVPGELVDMSEGALRCAVEAGAADVFLTGDSAVTAEFTLGGVDFVVPGRVDFLRPTRRPAEFEELVVLFDDPVPHVEALREYVAARVERVGED